MDRFLKKKLDQISGRIDGKVTILNFFIGTSCTHCNAQLGLLQEYKEELASIDVDVICVSSETETDVDSETEMPKRDYCYPIVIDEQYELFKHYGCFDKSPIHGTVILDQSGTPVWKVSGDAPFTDIPTLIEVLNNLYQSDSKTEVISN